MRLAYRTACEYNPTAINLLEGTENEREQGRSWRFHNPLQLLGPQKPLDLKYRTIAYKS